MIDGISSFEAMRAEERNGANVSVVKAALQFLGDDCGPPRYTTANVIVVAIMCAAFFGKGFGALGWTVIADTAPKEAIGLTGALFNAAGSVGGILTPIAIGMIITRTGSYDGALLYVGIHVLVAICAYWLLVGKIERYVLGSAGPVQR